MTDQQDINPLPDRRHLRRLNRVYVRDPIFYISTCVLHRQKVLARPQMAEAVVAALAESSQVRGWLVGRYVVMPDHVHFLCAPGARESELSGFVGAFKHCATRKAWQVGWQGRLWQPEFFDELITSRRLAHQKWEYMRLNPVRAKLCESPEEWPYQGELESL